MAKVNWKTQEEVQAEKLDAFRKNTQVTAFQALAALDDAGLLTQVEDLIADPNTSKKTKLAFEKAQVFRRNSPTILEIATSLGLSDQQLDDLFVAAQEIDA